MLSLVAPAVFAADAPVAPATGTPAPVVRPMHRVRRMMKKVEQKVEKKVVKMEKKVMRRLRHKGTAATPAQAPATPVQP